MDCLLWVDYLTVSQSYIIAFDDIEELLPKRFVQTCNPTRWEGQYQVVNIIKFELLLW